MPPRAGHGWWAPVQQPRWRGSVGVVAPGFWWGTGFWPGWAGCAWPGCWGPTFWGPGWGATVVVPTTVVSAPVVVSGAPPVTYVEREQPAEPVWWYWCNESRAYYPYVKDCPGGWQRVAPQSAAPADAQAGERR